MTPEPATDAATAASPFQIALRPLRLRDIGRWLALGLRDFRRAPAIGLFYGGCFVAMGWALLAVFKTAPAYVLGLSAGFLLVGPFLCMGLYHASDRLERGERPRLVDAALAWRRKLDTLAIFGVVLLVLEMLWARASLVIFALTFEGTNLTEELYQSYYGAGGATVHNFGSALYSRTFAIGARYSF